jgi:hypothetical protein
MLPLHIITAFDILDSPCDGCLLKMHEDAPLPHSSDNYDANIPKSTGFLLPFDICFFLI